LVGSTSSTFVPRPSPGSRKQSLACCDAKTRGWSIGSHPKSAR